VLLLVPLVIFAAYLVFGITGFGASPITIPVLVQLLPLPFVLPLAALLDLGSALALGFHTRRQADSRELLTLVPFTLLGLTLGVTLLLRLPRDATLLALGLFVCAYAVNLILHRETRRRLSRCWAAPAGIVGGLVGALFGMATISQMVILNVGLRVVAFGLAGLLVSTALWLAVAALLPVAWAGVWAGNRAHLRLAPATAARIIAAALFTAGAALIARTL